MSFQGRVAPAMISVPLKACRASCELRVATAATVLLAGILREAQNYRQCNLLTPQAVTVSSSAGRSTPSAMHVGEVPRLLVDQRWVEGLMDALSRISILKPTISTPEK